MIPSKLKIADNLSLPLDTVTQSIGILAKRRAGKSYLARRITEQLLQASQQVVIVDPKGDWWGIRSGADGKSPGFPVIILGGEHADLPLEVHAGELVAKLVVEEGVSILLDLSSLRKNEVARFMGGDRGIGGFLEAFYRLKARENYRSPVMLVVDEADAIAPQKPYQGEERMLGAIEDIVRRGGQRGIGTLCITQRSAVLNKNVLTQVQMLVALRTIAPQDLAAMNAWIDVHGTKEQRDILMESLPSLPVGDAWFWSPGWPTESGIFKRGHTLPIETFDSGATPKPGEKRIEPKRLADIDIEALKRQMAETVQKAKADDPKELKKRIAELERDARKATVSVAAPAKEISAERLQTEYEKGVQAERKRIAGEMGMLLKTIEKRLSEMLPLSVEVKSPGKSFSAAIGEEALAEIQFARAALAKTAPMPAEAPLTAHRPKEIGKSQPRPAPKKTGPPAESNGDVGRSGLRRMLIALAQRPKGLSDRQLGVRASLASGSGTFDTYLSKARTNGWIEGSRNLMRITDAGLQALGDYEPLPTGRDLLNHWLSELPGGAARMLAALADSYPQALTAEELGERANLAAGSGTFDTYLSKLRTLELLSGTRSDLRASEEFFE